VATDTNDLLTLGEGVAFTDDTSFGAGGTMVHVQGNGTVVYNGTTDYQGTIMINNANFEVNGLIDHAPVLVCRNMSYGAQRGMLSGSGTLTGEVFANSGTIYPKPGGTITLGSLILNSAGGGSLGSLVRIEINSSSVASKVTVTGTAELAGTLNIDIDPAAIPGSYIILTSSEVTGTFDTVTFTRATPFYTIIYQPTYVQLNYIGPALLEPPSHVEGTQVKNSFGMEYELYNHLTWRSSPSDAVVGYNIYRNGRKIGSVNASTYFYDDHNRLKGVPYVYEITSYNSSGDESSPVRIVISG
jgi:hypothetical protein